MSEKDQMEKSEAQLKRENYLNRLYGRKPSLKKKKEARARKKAEEKNIKREVNEMEEMEA